MPGMHSAKAERFPAGCRRGERVRAVRNLQLYETVAREIGQAVLTGQFPVGRPLPSERVLCEQLGVGRSTLREALVSLAALGIVSMQQGRGVFVQEVPSALLQSRLARLDQHPSMLDVAEARMAIEVAAAELAATRRSDRDLELMQEALEAMDAELDQGRTGVEEDALFHIYLLAASGNAVVRQLGEDLGALTHRIRHRALQDPGRARPANEEHWEVLVGLRNQDPAAAGAAMRKHLTYGIDLAATEFSNVPADHGASVRKEPV